MTMPYTSIEPGDIGFDGGLGWSGWIIRRATGAYGHCWVYHELLEDDGQGRQVWSTVEAGPSGVLVRVRTRPPVKVVRLWSTETDRRSLLAASQACVGKEYGWGEIARLAAHTVGLRVKGWKDNTDRMICSNHVAYAIAGMNRALSKTMPYPPPHIWPQRLAEWCDWVIWTRARAAENQKARRWRRDPR
jgi:hypothetical protein